MMRYTYGPASAGLPFAPPVPPKGYRYSPPAAVPPVVPPPAAAPPFAVPPVAPTLAPPFWNPYWYLTTLGLGWGLGGERRWGGTYTPQFLISGLPSDEEIEEMVYDAIDADPLIPYDAEINVESDAGTVTLTGTVSSKTIKHAAGDDAWWIPGVDDVRNELQVVPRRARPAAAPAAPAPTPGRRPAMRVRTR